MRKYLRFPRKKAAFQEGLVKGHVFGQLLQDDSNLQCELYLIHFCIFYIFFFQGQKNKSKKVKSGKSNPELTASSTNKALTFFKDIESDKIKQLYTHYKYDFEIFGYSATEYF